MNSLKKVIQYLSSLQSNDRGRIFELYCKWFLENDPVYSMQLKKVWLWKDWPENWGRDKGIDLIGETHKGEFWAIQAKCYDENYYITKEDVDKFLSESSRAKIVYRLLICTTDLLGDNAREVIAAQEKQVGICSLENLLGTSLDWPTSTESLQVRASHAPKVPRPHQEKAISDIFEGLQNYDRGQLYMACGTGKTLVGLWLSERLKCQNTLVLVPSISLVSQLYHEWAANAGTKFIPIFVCSDPTVNEKDQMVTNLHELGFPTTTNPHEIVSYFSSTRDVPKVVFSTYHSSPVLAKAFAIDENLMFDLTVADEAHRCAGAANSDFATIFDEEAIRSRHKLFMTATPKVFSEHVKAKAKEFEYEIISMDDEKKFGPVFHKLPFSAAISQDLLSDYQVIISVMDNETYLEYAEKGRFITINDHETDARTVASQLLVSKAIKDNALQRVITFHNRKSSAHEFINSFPKALELVSEEQRPNIGFYGSIFGEMQQTKRKSIIKLFESLERGQSGILANVKCLSEGVDVPALDGIAFIDPKGSEIDIVQAVGRAIRKSPEKKLGTIIIPLFVDVNEDGVINLEQSCFQTVWKVLKALRAHDDILAEELDNLRIELGKRTFKKPPKLGKITIDLPVGIGVDFSESLRTKILETCSPSWFYHFGLLQKFKEKTGHCNVPQGDSENKILGGWVTFQRSQYFNQKVSADRIAMLEEIGFSWDPRNAAWEEMYLATCKFKEINGHCNIPPKYSKDQQLGRWVDKQRARYKEQKLTKERLERLEKIGFSWDPSSQAWEEMFASLSNFKTKMGHCNVRHSYNKQLGSWISRQRNQYKQSRLSKDQIEKLEKLGISWDPESERWEEMFAALWDFKAVNLHCNVPPDYKKNLLLGSWVRCQRTRYKNGQLLPAQFDKLQQINFDWAPIDMAWEKMYSALINFKEANGHSNIPSTNKENKKLASWVIIQRIRYKQNKLSDERIKKLEQLNFIWDPINTERDEMLAALCEFKKIHEHCNVPQIYTKNQKLGSWVATQRTNYNKNKLSKELISKLENIGLIWDPHNSAWEEKLSDLNEFKKMTGHCRVPKEYPENPPLGSWVSKQRKLFNKGTLSSERSKRLEELGVIWDPRDDLWEQRYAELCEFKLKTVNYNLKEYSDENTLNSWMRTQRSCYRKGTLSQERIQKLEAVEFIWDDQRELTWENQYEALCLYKKMTGHCNVPRKDAKNPRLSSWVALQRQQYREKNLPTNRIAQLEQIGFIWEPYSALWEEMFNALCIYNRQNNHCNIPAKDPKNLPLGSWVARQREQHRKGKLLENQINALESIGFVWEPKSKKYQ